MRNSGGGAAVAGMKLYLASGTDVEDVRAEAAALGFAEFFEGRIYGSVGDVNVEAKRVVLDRIFRDNAISPEALVTIGDGPVKMRETRKTGGDGGGAVQRRTAGLRGQPGQAPPSDTGRRHAPAARFHRSADLPGRSRPCDSTKEARELDQGGAVALDDRPDADDRRDAAGTAATWRRRPSGWCSPTAASTSCTPVTSPTWSSPGTKGMRSCRPQQRRVCAPQQGPAAAYQLRA